MNTGTKVTTGATATTHDIELPEPAFTAGTKIGTTTGFFCRDSKIKKGDGAYTREQVIAAIEPYAKRIAELEAARIAYASEFAPDEDGNPDVGSIHENIRKLKADRKRRGEPVARLVALYDAAKIKYRAECSAYYEGQADAYDMAIQIVESAGPQPAEPVKVPSDAELFRLAHDHCDETDASGQVERFSTTGTAVAFARDVLRLYGHPEQPSTLAEIGKVDAKASVPSEEIIEAVEAYGMAYSLPNTTATELTIRLQDIRAMIARYGNTQQEK